MRETTCQFGDGDHLIGVVAEHETARRRTAVVLVNAGLVGKAGPFRLYAQLARQLASAGFTVLRFDLGGVGDSPAVHASEPLRVRTAIEIRAAIDHVMARGDCDGVVLGGLCSGAEDAFRAAEVDARVRGVVMIDPFAYRTAGWRRHHLIYRAARRALRAIGVYEPMIMGSPSTRRDAGERVVTYAYIERAEATRILGALLARRVHVHFVYTGGSRETFNHAGQLAAMFPELELAPLVTLDHLPQLDHTQLLYDDRRTMIAAIAARLSAANAR